MPPAWLPGLLARLDSIDGRLARLEETAGGLLVGWDAIARLCAKRPRTLRTYRAFGFPVVRWGSRVYSSVPLISEWLVKIEGRRLSGSLPPYNQRPPRPTRIRGGTA
jgi:hypothetical protein